MCDHPESSRLICRKLSMMRQVHFKAVAYPLPDGSGGAESRTLQKAAWSQKLVQGACMAIEIFILD